MDTIGALSSMTARLVVLPRSRSASSSRGARCLRSVSRERGAPSRKSALRKVAARSGTWRKRLMRRKSFFASGHSSCEPIQRRCNNGPMMDSATRRSLSRRRDCRGAAEALSASTTSGDARSTTSSSTSCKTLQMSSRTNRSTTGASAAASDRSASSASSLPRRPLRAASTRACIACVCTAFASSSRAGARWYSCRTAQAFTTLGSPPRRCSAALSATRPPCTFAKARLEESPAASARVALAVMHSSRWEHAAMAARCDWPTPRVTTPAAARAASRTAPSLAQPPLPPTSSSIAASTVGVGGWGGRRRTAARCLCRQDGQR
mmetsp:Transcript_7687/g.25302  ORF Transcript_7687/g.25302 Transcript_7687/m.25302 type:complete len:321 (+) Transcript_7687:2705-3667(+)